MRKILALALLTAFIGANAFEAFMLYEQDALNEHFETTEIGFYKYELPTFYKERWEADYKEVGWIEPHQFECRKKNDYYQKLTKSRSINGVEITFEESMSGGNPGESRYRAEFKCESPEEEFQFYLYSDFINYAEFIGLMEAAVSGCENAVANNFVHPDMTVEEAEPTEEPTPEPTLEPTPEPSPEPTPEPTQQASLEPSPEPTPTTEPATEPAPATSEESDYSTTILAWVVILLIGFSTVIYLGKK